MFLVKEDLGDAGAHEALNPTSSTGITSTLIKPNSGFHKGFIARSAFITVETQPIRFRIDGNDPTSTTGHLVAANESITITGGTDLTNFRCIDTSAGASTVRVTIFY